ncbi:MAG: aminoglycoside phosphotransferase family protein [Acidobacteriota bacterium]|nr:aminoglycoside phosphotransferase family protein [Acidobacteriota bacterium]
MASVDLSTARRLIANMKTFGGQPVHVTSIYDHHNEEKCFRVEIGDGSPGYKVRFATATSRHSVAREHEALRILRQHEVAWAPRICEFRADEPAYLVTAYAEGVSLDKELSWVPHAESIFTGLGQLLGDIHEINGDYYGHLSGPPYASWQAFVDVRFWRHVLPLVRAGFISENDLRRIRALYDGARDALDEVRPILLHGDVKPANIVFDASRGRTVLVDFELARFGDVDFEWSKLYRLALRWPEYRRLIAEPTLSRVSFDQARGRAGDAKLLLYEVYHACSFLDFELETGLPSPHYRLSDLAELLRAVRSHEA